MRAIERFSLTVSRKNGGDLASSSEAALSVMRQPWFQRGIAAFTRLMGHCAANDDDAQDDLVAFSAGYGEGATDALRLARVILSDPVVRGHEDTALAMLAQGFGHADVKARIANIKAGRSVPHTTDDGEAGA